MWTPKDTFDNRSNTCVKRSVRRYPESELKVQSEIKARKRKFYEDKV